VPAVRTSPLGADAGGDLLPEAERYRNASHKTTAATTISSTTVAITNTITQVLRSSSWFGGQCWAILIVSHQHRTRDKPADGQRWGHGLFLLPCASATLRTLAERLRTGRQAGPIRATGSFSRITGQVGISARATHHATDRRLCPLLSGRLAAGQERGLVVPGTP
jgi:hypothetical protein